LNSQGSASQILTDEAKPTNQGAVESSRTSGWGFGVHHTYAISEKDSSYRFSNIDLFLDSTDFSQLFLRKERDWIRYFEHEPSKQGTTGASMLLFGFLKVYPALGPRTS
jgi:hypothetical protein